MELFSQYAVAAAKEAIEQSGLDMTKEDPFRVGCSVGSGIGSMQVVEKSCEILETKGPGRLNPLMIPLLISNMASGNVSIQFGLRGKNSFVLCKCSSITPTTINNNNITTTQAISPTRKWFDDFSFASFSGSETFCTSSASLSDSK